MVTKMDSIFHTRYLHKCYLMAVLPQAHYQSSYSNLAWVQVFWVFTATFTLVEPPSQVRAAAISAGVMGAPSEFSPTLHYELQKKATSVKLSSVE